MRHSNSRVALSRMALVFVAFGGLGCESVALVGQDFGGQQSLTEELEDESIASNVLLALDTDSDNDEILDDVLLPRFLLQTITCDGQPEGFVTGEVPGSDPDGGLETDSYGDIETMWFVKSGEMGPYLVFENSQNELLYLIFACKWVVAGQYEVVKDAEEHCSTGGVIKSYSGASSIEEAVNGTFILDQDDGCLAGRFVITYGEDEHTVSGWFRSPPYQAEPVPIF